MDDTCLAGILSVFVVCFVLYGPKWVGVGNGQVDKNLDVRF